MALNLRKTTTLPTSEADILKFFFYNNLPYLRFPNGATQSLFGIISNIHQINGTDHDYTISVPNESKVLALIIAGKSKQENYGTAEVRFNNDSNNNYHIQRVEGDGNTEANGFNALRGIRETTDRIRFTTWYSSHGSEYLHFLLINDFSNQAATFNWLSFTTRDDDLNPVCSHGSGRYIKSTEFLTSITVMTPAYQHRRMVVIRIV